MKTKNEIKTQITEKLMVSIKNGELNLVIDLTDGFYVAGVVMSTKRNQLEVVGYSTPNADITEKEMVGNIFEEMLSNGEIARMIKSVSHSVTIIPFEDFNHRQYLYDWVNSNVNKDTDVYFL